MKAFITLLFNLAALLLLIPQSGRAQTFLYNFSNPTKEVNGGNNYLGVGSVYLYSKIDGTATDAIVKITNATGGLTLSTFDNDNVANGGYTQAFQPTIVVPGTGGSGTVNGYVEFQITFIKTGTYNTSTQSGTLFPQTASIPATVLDDDGTLSGGTLYEYDELNLGTGEVQNYSANGGQLTYSTNSGYIIGTNSTGTNYSGISTTATAVMFTVLNTGISSMYFRTGVISTFTAAPAGRVSSLAFFLPTYPDAVLASSPIGSFTGVKTNNAVQLHWRLTAEQGLAGVDLERSINSGSFTPVKSLTLNDSNEAAPYSFNDAGFPSGGTISYRLKAAAVSGESWYSDVLNFNIPTDKRFLVYPNPVVNALHIAFTGSSPGSGTLQLLDYSGHVVWRQQVAVNTGENSYYVPRPAGLSSGNYIIVLQFGQETYTQKIVFTPLSS